MTKYTVHSNIYSIIIIIQATKHTDNTFKEAFCFWSFLELQEQITGKLKKKRKQS